MRLRVCGVIIRNETILMVRHKHDERDYWTLPGGGVLSEETLEQAVIREVKEETNLSTKVIKFLFKEPYSQGICHYFLLKHNSQQEPEIGIDPEEADLPQEKRMLQGLAWHTLESMKDDIQVSKVLPFLRE